MRTQKEKEEEVKKAVKEFEVVGGAVMEYLIEKLKDRGISGDFTKEAVEKGMRKGTYYVEDGLIKVNESLGP